MRRRRIMAGWKRTALAATLAYTLALQGLLLALGGAMHVQAAGLPETVLCVTGEDRGAPHHPDASDHVLCCVLGSQPVGAPSGFLPAAAAIVDRKALPLDLRPVVARVSPRLAPDVLPLGSRAPPRLG